MLEVKTLIRKLGPTRSNVLITGESGTGKELVARALHAQGLEPDAPFLAINCAAIPHELLENQLFGHIRGSFTGADRDRSGLFAAAGRGTVFLDEIGELPLLTQAKLLRAIEAKEVLPIGATRPEPIAARVVAATNKDLAAEVARRPVPRGPLLPAQRREHPPAPPPRPSRGHPRPDRRPPRPPRQGPEQADRRPRQRDRPPARRRPLEGERPRAGQRPRTSGDPRRRPDPDPRRLPRRPRRRPRPSTTTPTTSGPPSTASNASTSAGSSTAARGTRKRPPAASTSASPRSTASSKTPPESTRFA